MHFHSLPSVSVIPVCPASWSRTWSYFLMAVAVVVVVIWSPTSDVDACPALDNCLLVFLMSVLWRFSAWLQQAPTHSPCGMSRARMLSNTAPMSHCLEGSPFLPVVLPPWQMSAFNGLKGAAARSWNMACTTLMRTSLSPLRWSETGTAQTRNSWQQFDGCQKSTFQHWAKGGWALCDTATSQWLLRRNSLLTCRHGNAWWNDSHKWQGPRNRDRRDRRWQMNPVF